MMSICSCKFHPSQPISERMGNSRNGHKHRGTKLSTLSEEVKIICKIMLIYLLMRMYENGRGEKVGSSPVVKGILLLLLLLLVYCNSLDLYVRL